MKKTKLHVGEYERIVTEDEVRNAQAALLHGKLGKNDIALIDAIISHFVCGRDTKWIS